MRVNGHRHRMIIGTASSIAFHESIESALHHRVVTIVIGFIVIDFLAVVLSKSRTKSINAS